MNKWGFVEPSVFCFLLFFFSNWCMSGWYKRGELNIWTETKVFNISKQFTGMDDLWCYSEIFIMYPLYFMKRGQAHKPGDTSWHKNSDWRLTKKKEKKNHFCLEVFQTEQVPGKMSWILFQPEHLSALDRSFVFKQSWASSISSKRGKASVT